MSEAPRRKTIAEIDLSWAEQGALSAIRKGHVQKGKKDSYELIVTGRAVAVRDLLQRLHREGVIDEAKPVPPTLTERLAGVLRPLAPPGVILEETEAGELAIHREEKPPEETSVYSLPLEDLKALSVQALLKDGRLFS